jgi:hypothetical protein
MPGLSCSKRLVSALAILSSMAGRSSPGASSTLAGAVTFARWWSKGSTPALGLVPVPLQLDEFGQPHDQAGEFLRRRSAGKLPLAVFNGAAAGPMG